MSAIYALARRIDDIGDGDLPVDRKREALDRRAQAPRRSRRRRATTPCWWRSPTPTPATRCRSTSSSCSSTAASSTSTGAAYAIVRRSRRLLPPRRRLDRAAVARRLRHRRPGVGRAARRRARRGPAGHQHPARRRRGSHRWGASTSRATRRPLRVRARPLRAACGSDGAGRRSRCPGPRSTSPTGCSCCRCSTGAAGRASRRWPASIGGCWPGSSRPRPRCSAGGCRSRRRRRSGSPPAASRWVVAEPTRAARAQVGESSSSAAGWPGSRPRSTPPTPAPRSRCSNAGAPRRADLVVRARRAHVRQRPARVHALLHRVPRVPRPHRRRRAGDAAGATRRPRPGPGASARSDRTHRPAGPAAPRPARSPATARLAPAARLRAVLAARRCGSVDPDDPALDVVTFGAWLADARPGRAGRSPRCGTSIARPTLNLPAAEASLALAAKVFRTGLLDRADAADIGWSGVPLGELHGDVAAAALVRRAASRWSRRPASARSPAAADGFVVRTAEGPAWDVDAVVVAVPHRSVAGLLAPSLPPARLGRATGIRPQLGTLADRQRAPRATTAASPTCRSSPPSTRRCSSCSTAPSAAGLQGGGQYLAISLSAADEQLATSADELVATMVGRARRAVPGGVAAPGSSTAVVTRERRATFRGVPGSAAHRAAAGVRHPGPGLRRSVDRHRLAGHDGGRGAQRPRRGARRPRRCRSRPTDEWTRCRREPAAPRRRHPPTHSGARPTGPARRGRPPVARRLRPPVEYHLGWTDVDGNAGRRRRRQGRARRARRAVGGRRRRRRVRRRSRRRRHRAGPQLLADPRRRHRRRRRAPPPADGVGRVRRRRRPSSPATP